MDDLQDALSREVVHDIEHPKTPAAGQLIGDKVHRPALIDRIGKEYWDSRSKELFTFLGADLQAFLAIDPVGPLAIDDPPFDPQHVVQRWTAVLRIPFGQLLEAFTQRAVIAALPAIPHAAEAPASCSFKIEMIFSSEYRLPFIERPPWVKNTGKFLNLPGPDYGRLLTVRTERSRGANRCGDPQVPQV